MTLSIAPHRPALSSRLWTDAPTFTALAMCITLAMVPMIAALGLDPRQFQGESVWIKPLKFHLALVIYLLTLAFFARYMPATTRNGRVWRGFSAVVATTVLAELLWIGGAASLGTASHFNTSTPAMAMIYSLMGAAAVTLTAGALVVGLSIWRNPSTGLHPALKLSIVLGLVLTFVLTIVTAGYMAGTTGHHVGTPVTGARLAVMGWSREVGDLRVAHFIATHALHALPVAGWLASRWLPPAQAIAAVIAAALAYVSLTGLVFAQAIAGAPLF
jgi:hypothetical protein